MDGEDPSRQSDFVAIRSKQSNTLCANYLQIHPRLIHLVGSAVQVQRAAKCRKQVPVSLVKRRHWIWKKVRTRFVAEVFSQKVVVDLKCNLIHGP